MGQARTIEARRSEVVAATSELAGLSEVVVGVGSTGLGPLLREVDDLSREVEAARGVRNAGLTT